jgi:hypothetical protein
MKVATAISIPSDENLSSLQVRATWSGFVPDDVPLVRRFLFVSDVWPSR